MACAEGRVSMSMHASCSMTYRVIYLMKILNSPTIQLFNCFCRILVAIRMFAVEDVTWVSAVFSDELPMR